MPYWLSAIKARSYWFQTFFRLRQPCWQTQSDKSISNCCLVIETFVPLHFFEFRFQWIPVDKIFLAYFPKILMISLIVLPEKKWRKIKIWFHVTCNNNFALKFTFQSMSIVQSVNFGSAQIRLNWPKISLNYRKLRIRKSNKINKREGFLFKI